MYCFSEALNIKVLQVGPKFSQAEGRGFESRIPLNADNQQVRVLQYYSELGKIPMRLREIAAFAGF